MGGVDHVLHFIHRIIHIHPNIQQLLHLILHHLNRPLHHPSKQQTPRIISQHLAEFYFLDFSGLEPCFVGESPVHPGGAIFELDAPNNICPGVELWEITILQGDVHFLLCQIKRIPRRISHIITQRHILCINSRVMSPLCQSLFGPGAPLPPALVIDRGVGEGHLGCGCVAVGEGQRAHLSIHSFGVADCEGWGRDGLYVGHFGFG